MTDKQAAETLRTMANPMVMDPKDTSEAAERGADAIEMLAWLFGSGRIIRLQQWWRSADDEQQFRAFCEAKWRESRNV